jgi:glycosyltransferase involved in cell wall biosynthesis
VVDYRPGVAASHDLLVFIPAWNEEENLPAVLAEVAAELPEADVLVVDDGSTDCTAGVASEGGAEVLSFPENRGLKASIAAGWRYAAEHGYALVGRVDADGQHPVDELARLVTLVREDACDVAVGSRFVSGEGYKPYRYRPDHARRFGTALLRRALVVPLGKPFADATSGMYAANAKAVPLLAEPYESGAPEVEALMRLNRAGLRVDEVAVNMRERASGESKLQGRKAFMLVVTVIGALLSGVVAARRRR